MMARRRAPISYVPSRARIRTDPFDEEGTNVPGQPFAGSSLADGLRSAVSEIDEVRDDETEVRSTSLSSSPSLSSENTLIPRVDGAGLGP
jgi:hypothetical protein